MPTQFSSLSTARYKPVLTDFLNLFPLVFTVRFLARIYNTGTIKVSLNCTLPISLYYSKHNFFKSQTNYSQADFFNCELPVATSYRQLNSRLCWEPCYIAVVQTRIIENTSRDRYSCLTSPRITETHVS
jgi:hypothetical protein